MFTLYYWIFIIVCMYCLYTGLKNEKKKNTDIHTDTDAKAPVPNHMNLSPVLTMEPAAERPWAQRLGSEGGSQWPLHPLQAQDIGLKKQKFQQPPHMALLGSGCCRSSADQMKPLSRTTEYFSFSHFLIIFGYRARVIVNIFFS